MNPAWDNLDDFLQEDDFAHSGIIHLASGESRPVVGIFDDPFLTAAAGGYDRDQVKPTFQLKFSDTYGVRRGDWFEICGENGKYDILTTPQGDGTGMCMLDMARR